MATEIGTRIRAARKEQGMTREQVAVSVGVGLRTIQRWEQGANTPTIRRLDQLAQVLGKPLAYFIAGEREAA